MHHWPLSADYLSDFYDWRVYVGLEDAIFSMTLCVTIQLHDNGATFKCQEPVVGRYVTVVNRAGPVLICDFQIFGKHGFFCLRFQDEGGLWCFYSYLRRFPHINCILVMVSYFKPLQKSLLYSQETHKAIPIFLTFLCWDGRLKCLKTHHIHIMGRTLKTYLFM